jgi:hypothetical protein
MSEQSERNNTNKRKNMSKQSKQYNIKRKNMLEQSEQNITNEQNNDDDDVLYFLAKHVVTTSTCSTEYDGRFGYDMKTRRYKFTKNYHISTGYKYKAPYENQCNIINDLINDILPDKVDKDNFMKMAKLALSGHRNDTMFIFSGDGSNGKSTLLSLLMALLGNDYSCEMPEYALHLSLDELQHAMLSHLENKRLAVVYCNEKRKLSGDILKTNKMTTKISYRGKTDIKLNLTCAYVVNNLDDIDESVLKNSIIINFKTKFVQDATKNNEKLVNPFIGTSVFNDTYKHAMFYNILHYKP